MATFAWKDISGGKFINALDIRLLETKKKVSYKSIQYIFDTLNKN